MDFSRISLIERPHTKWNTVASALLFFFFFVRHDQASYFILFFFSRGPLSDQIRVKNGSREMMRRYDATELKQLTPTKAVNVVTYLDEQNLLIRNNFFKGRKIWRLTEDFDFERHIDVELMADDAAVFAVQQRMNCVAVRLYGESGCGKTSTAILSCRELDLCIVMTPQLFVGVGEAEGMSVHGILERRIYRTVPSYHSLKEFTGNVVLVVDEVNSEYLVRRLSDCRSEIVRLVKDSLKVTGDVGLVICGFGCESAEESLGSYPSSFVALPCPTRPFRKHVIELMAKKGFIALSELLSGEEPTSASYYHKMSIDSASLGYVQRLMLNRRFSAALLNELDRLFSRDNKSEITHHDNDKTIPWLTVLPTLVCRALLKFKLSRFQSQSWDATSMLFARALAYCFGGPKQAIDGAVDLQRTFGMITDNADVCSSFQVDVSISAQLSSGRYIALRRGDAHFGRRVQMSPAITEMGIQRFSLSTVARAGTGDAFETAVTDWIYCWCLACNADVPITLLGEENGTIHAVPLSQDVDEKDATARQALLTVMMKMRDVLKASQPKSAVVLRVSLTEEVESVAIAEKAAFAQAWALIGEADVSFVLVAQNAQKASFAELFVVAGRTCDPSSKRTVAPTALFVAMQAKHRERTPTMSKKEEVQHHFISLVHFSSNDSACLDIGTRTVWIRRGALASVMHPISLGADPKQDLRSSDAEKCDLRKQGTDQRKTKGQMAKNKKRGREGTEECNSQN